MNEDTPTLADPAPIVSQAEPVQRRSRSLALLALLLALVAMAGSAFLWNSNLAAARQAAQDRDAIGTLQARLAAVEARPLPPPPPDLRPLEQKVAAIDLAPLEQKVDAIDLAPLQQKIDAIDLAPLEQKIDAIDLAPLQQRSEALDQRLTSLERKPPPQAQLTEAGQQQIAALASRVDGIAARQNLLGTGYQTDIGALRSGVQADIDKAGSSEQADIGRLQGEIGKLSGQVAALDTRAAAAAKAGGDILALSARETRTAQLQAAAAALQAGHPVGNIPDAPPALARFAAKPPPTEASLRLSFDAAAQQAQASGQPYQDKTPFLTRLWDRAQSSLTVREGDRVIVGDAVSGVLDHARTQLDAGDLAGAVAALDGLAGPAAEAMAPWRAQAQSLLDARGALMTAANG